MTFLDRILLTTAAAALLALHVAGPASAQQSDSDAQSGATEQSGAAEQADQTTDEQQDALVATVDEAEIRGSDVMTVIGLLPPELAAQPQEMLVSMAMEQLILRELILEEARGQNLAEDPEVQSLVEGSMAGAEEDAMVQVWIDREMQGAVTDEAVQQVYSDLQASSQQEVPPLEQIRPQIEQHLRQQNMQEIAMRLQEGADIVFYDASGQPIERPQNAGDQGGSGASGNGDASQEGSTDADADATGDSQDN